MRRDVPICHARRIRQAARTRDTRGATKADDQTNSQERDHNENGSTQKHSRQSTHKNHSPNLIKENLDAQPNFDYPTEKRARWRAKTEFHELIQEPQELNDGTLSRSKKLGNTQIGKTMENKRKTHGQQKRTAQHDSGPLTRVTNENKQFRVQITEVHFPHTG